MYFIGLHNSELIYKHPTYCVHNIGKICTSIMSHYLHNICIHKYCETNSLYTKYTYILNCITVHILHMHGDINSTGHNIYKSCIYNDIMSHTIVIVYEDITMNTMQVKFKHKTKTNHNGSKSIHKYINDFWDIRIGYKKPQHTDTCQFVLSNINLKYIENINKIANIIVNLLSAQTNKDKIIKSLCNTLNK